MHISSHNTNLGASYETSHEGVQGSIHENVHSSAQISHILFFYFCFLPMITITTKIVTGSNF